MKTRMTIAYDVSRLLGEDIYAPYPFEYDIEDEFEDCMDEYLREGASKNDDTKKVLSNVWDFFGKELIMELAEQNDEFLDFAKEYFEEDARRECERKYHE